MSTLISTSTANLPVDHKEPVTVSEFLKLANVDVTNGKEVVVRIGRDRVGMDHMVKPGDTVLLTYNIEGG